MCDVQNSRHYLCMKLIVMSKLMQQSQVSNMSFDVITQMKTFNAETQQSSGSECCCCVTLLRGNGHGV